LTLSTEYLTKGTGPGDALIYSLYMIHSHSALHNTWQCDTGT